MKTSLANDFAVVRLETKEGPFYYRNISGEEYKVLCVADNPNSILNEMWFLTIDPFVGISVFIAKLSKRQYCWRVIADFHCQEYVKFFDIHNCFFMRLHFSIGWYDYRGTARFRQSIHFSFTQVLFADHVH